MGIFDLTSYAPGAKYLSPEEQQNATTMGWLNTASALANMSAPSTGAAATPLQLLTGGLQGFGKGANQYTSMLADQYKTMSAMERQKAMGAYIASNGDSIRAQYGIPEGMPISPEVLADMASKAGIRNAENQSDLTYKPQIAGATAQAELPSKKIFAGYQSGLDYSKESRLAGLRDFYDRQKPREIAPGATLVAPDGSGTFGQVYQNPNPAPGTQEGQIDKWYAEKYTGLQDAAIAGRTKLQNIKTIDNALGDIQTGKFGDTALDIKKGLKRIGIESDAPDNMGKQEFAQTLSRQMALEARNPAGGAGMPGAMSDSDRNYLNSMQPGLEMTAAGRKQLIEVTEKIQKRNEEVAKLARDYRSANSGKLDDGFLEKLKAHAEENPLFDPMGSEGIKIDGNAPVVRRYNPATGRLE